VVLGTVVVIVVGVGRALVAVVDDPQPATAITATPPRRRGTRTVTSKQPNVSGV
jgi:hypothetical protein